MNGSDYVEESCAQFYPASLDGAAVLRTANKATVTLLQLDHVTNHVTRRVIRHVSTDDNDPWTVTQLQFRSWKMYDQVRSAMILFTQ